MAGVRHSGQCQAESNLPAPLPWTPKKRAVGRLLQSLLLVSCLLLSERESGVSGQPSSAESAKPGFDPSVRATAEQPLAAPPKLPTVQMPTPPQPAVGVDSDHHLDKTPPRKTKGLDLIKMGWSYNCMECHKLLEAKWHRDRPMVEHGALKLEHGNNRFCLNCHHATNRNAFVDYDGSEIPEADVVLLCAKCHGPTFRDWQAGVHGRRNGFWNSQKGPRTQLRCIQCHDPHQPVFQPLKPLPPPHYPVRAPRSSGHEHGLTDAKEPQPRLAPIQNRPKFQSP